KYLFELKLPRDSKLVGQTVGELRDALTEHNADLLTLIHSKKKIAQVHRRITLAANDLLMVQGSQENIDKLASQLGLQLVSAESARQEVLHGEDTQIMEAVVAPDSRADGRNVGQIRFNRNFGVNLLAISRQGNPYRERLRDITLTTG